MKNVVCQFMFKYIFLLLLLGWGNALWAQSNTGEQNTAALGMELAYDAYDFGVVQRGEKTQYIFVLKNTADSALYIKHVTSACDCTVPRYRKKRIRPQKDFKLKVAYNSLLLGEFEKWVYVYTDRSFKPLKLTITGLVLDADENAY